METACLRIKFTPLLQKNEKNNSKCCLEIVPEVSCIQNLDKLTWRQETNFIEYTIPMTYKVILKKQQTVKNNSDEVVKTYHSCVDLLLSSSKSTLNVGSGDVSKIISDTFIISKNLTNGRSKESFIRFNTDGPKTSDVVHTYPVSHKMTNTSLDLKDVDAKETKSNNEEGKVYLETDEQQNTENIILDTVSLDKITNTEDAYPTFVNTLQCGNTMAPAKASDVPESRRRLSLSPICSVSTQETPLLKQNVASKAVTCKIYDSQKDLVPLGCISTPSDLSNEHQNSNRALSTIIDISEQNSSKKLRSKCRIPPEIRVAEYVQYMEKEVLPFKIMLNEIFSKCAALGITFSTKSSKQSLFFNSASTYSITRSQEISKSNRVVYSIVFDVFINMNNQQAVVEQIVQNLAFEVEAVPKNKTVHDPSISQNTPMNVKIRVRKKETHQQHDVSSVADDSTKTPHKIRLVSSDQTIMSFDVFMEAEFEKEPMRKPRKHILDILKPGKFLRADDNDYSYKPSSSYSANISEPSVIARPDGVLKQKFTLSKNTCNNYTVATQAESQKWFFGQCKSGGCLDPPFSEDKYSYKPSLRSGHVPTDVVEEKSGSIKEELADEDVKLRSADKSNGKRSSIFNSGLFKKNRKSSDKSTDTKLLDKKETDSIISIYQVESADNSSRTHSNSIITYPPEISTNLRISEDRTIRSRGPSDDKSRKSLNDHSELYFVPPKKASQMKDKDMLEQNYHSTNPSYDVTYFRNKHTEPSNIPVPIPIPIPLPINLVSSQRKSEDETQINDANIGEIKSTSDKEIDKISKSSSGVSEQKLKKELVTGKIDERQIENQIEFLKLPDSSSDNINLENDKKNMSKVKLQKESSFRDTKDSKHNSTNNLPKDKIVKDSKLSPLPIPVPLKFGKISKSSSGVSEQKLKQELVTGKIDESQIENQIEFLKLPDSSSDNINLENDKKNMSEVKLQKESSFRDTKDSKHNSTNNLPKDKIVKDSKLSPIPIPVPLKFGESQGASVDKISSTEMTLSKQSLGTKEIPSEHSKVIDQDTVIGTGERKTSGGTDGANAKYSELYDDKIDSVPYDYLRTQSEPINDGIDTLIIATLPNDIRRESSGPKITDEFLKPTKQKDTTDKDNKEICSIDTYSPNYLEDMFCESKLPIADADDKKLSRISSNSVRNEIPKIISQYLVPKSYSVAPAVSISNTSPLSISVKTISSDDQNQNLSESLRDGPSNNDEMKEILRIGIDHQNVTDTDSCKLPSLNSENENDAHLKKLPQSSKLLTPSASDSKFTDRGSNNFITAPVIIDNIEQTLQFEQFKDLYSETNLINKPSISGHEVDDGGDIFETKKSPSIIADYDDNTIAYSTDSHEVVGAKSVLYETDESAASSTLTKHKESISSSDKPVVLRADTFEGGSDIILKPPKPLSKTNIARNELTNKLSIQDTVGSTSIFSSTSTAKSAMKKDTISVELAFHSYINDKNERILKTFDAANEPKRLPNDSITIIKSQIKLSSNELRIPVDSDFDLSLHMKKINTNQHVSISESGFLDTYDNKLIKQKAAVQTSGGEIKDSKIESKIVNNNIVNLYEQELVPLQMIIKNLKEEIDVLAAQQLAFSDKIYCPKKSMLPRLVHSNKKCVGCLKK